jgi:hypothetical protein
MATDTDQARAAARVAQLAEARATRALYIHRRKLAAAAALLEQHGYQVTPPDRPGSASATAAGN